MKHSHGTFETRVQIDVTLAIRLSGEPVVIKQRAWDQKSPQFAKTDLVSHVRTGHDGLNNTLPLKEFSDACNLILQVNRARQRDDKS